MTTLPRHGLLFACALVLAAFASPRPADAQAVVYPAAPYVYPRTYPAYVYPRVAAPRAYYPYNYGRSSRRYVANQRHWPTGRGVPVAKPWLYSR